MRFFDVVWWWFLHASGADNPSGPQYGFWSGFGSDIMEFAILGSLVHLAHEHNCQVKGCWRVGLHKTDAGHKACKKHHPTRDCQMTAQELLDRHDAVKKPGTI